MIQGIEAYRVYSVKQKSTQKRTSIDVTSSKPVKRAIKDTYSPSPDRKKFLDTVKERVKSGYYASEEVIEDLSNSFAGAFDTALQ